jgi:hypothetical protein
LTVVEEQNFGIWYQIGAVPNDAKKQTCLDAAAGAISRLIYHFFQLFWKLGIFVLSVVENWISSKGSAGYEYIKKTDNSTDSVELSSAKLSFKKEDVYEDAAGFDPRSLRGSGYEGPERGTQQKDQFI